MPIFDNYDASKAGPTGTLAFSNLSATRLLTIPNAGVSGPMLLMLRATTNVYLRQGGSTITATSADFLLVAGVYWPLLIETPEDAYLSALGETATGTLFLTNTADLNTTPNSV